MKKTERTILRLLLLFAVMMSIPWLVPHTGPLALFALVPLLLADRIEKHCPVKGFFWWYYTAFVLWNFCTTFWVCNATVGGGIFASLANALQMAAMFALFRLSGKHFKGPLPYVFLAVMWIAWERHYFSVDISWPWLTLGNAFAGSVSCVQFYSITGSLGGSLWIWLSNLCVFTLVISFSEGSWWDRQYPSQMLSLAIVFLVVAGPLIASEVMYFSYDQKSESRISALVAQPDFDPYQKFNSLNQSEQTAILLSQFEQASRKTGDVDLFVAPETFTSDICLNDLSVSPTYREFGKFLSGHPSSDLLFGASSYELYPSGTAPHVCAVPMSDGGWYISHNSAILTNASDSAEVYQKSKLVVGVEMTPYPKIFTGIDSFIGKILGQSTPLMGRCVGQSEPSVLHLSDGTPFGCAVCYESVYGEYCAEFVRRGARFLSVITNDAWWGDTPGYRQHLNYSRLRAIELRRDIVRCANTGISAFINQRGDIVGKTLWWERDTLSGEVNLNSEQSAFVRLGDVVGKVCSFAFLLLCLALAVRLVLRKE